MNLFIFDSIEVELGEPGSTVSDHSDGATSELLGSMVQMH